MFKRSTVISLLFILALVAAACGAPAPVATPAAETQAAPPATEAETATDSSFPVTIPHKYGSTTIEQAPVRIVLVGLNEQDSLLALGIVPVATSEWYGGRPGAIFEWAQDELAAIEGAEVPVVLDSVQINFEQIASLEPDVIIGLYSGLTEQEYSTLSAIAPTVAQPAEYIDWGIPWQEVTRTIGKIVGKSAEAEALISGVEADFAEVRAQYPEFQDAEGVVATAYGHPVSFYAFSSQDIRGRIIAALGFQNPPIIDELAGDEYGASISYERFDLIDVDLVIWADTMPEDLRTNPLYTSLDVVKDGRVYYIEGTDTLYDALNFATVLSLPYSIERMTPMLDGLSQALKGN
ncbi:MAG: iron-siderophore ABC transporter substrate-binding protein [Anaerolineales bacterium]|nr:iron-siderophore ABC transporter substrate-binding protein [Anaerolineales bacterium]